MINVRNACLGDLKEMQELFVGTISSVCKNDYNPYQIKVWSSSASNTQRWLDALDKQFFLIAEINDKIVGYGSLENNNYIDFFYVHKDLQRKGIGQVLISALEVQVKKSGTRILTSDVSITARPFFEKNGFTVVREQRRMIKGIEIVNYKMEKRLYSAL